MNNRPGYAFSELIVTLALSGIVAAALTSVLLTQLRLARVVGDRLAVGDAVRLTMHALPAELRFSAAATDLHGFAADSVAGRFVRLSGRICAAAPARLWARLEGMREPDPQKDSLLSIGAGGEQAFPLAAVVADSAACPGTGPGTVYRLDTVGEPPAAGALLVFESGSYFLRDRALRYRLGREGRQPLTDEAFRGAGNGLSLGVTGSHPRLEVALAATAADGTPIVFAGSLVLLNRTDAP